jgi:hypothetical protein
MASRLAGFTAVLALAICTGCGAASSTQPSGNGFDVRQEAAALDDVSVYSVAPAKLRVLASHFVEAAAEYDAGAEAGSDFLGRLSALVTPDQEQRLDKAPRARLPWQLLRRRAERTRVTITGVSESIGVAGQRFVIVESVVTTTTDFASVRSFEEFVLTAVLTRAGWRIDRASGPGL